MEAEHTKKFYMPSAASLEKGSFIVLVATLILGFLSFAPTAFISPLAVKTFVIAAGTFVSAILFLLSKIKEKSFTFFFHLLVWVGAYAALVAVLASLFSPSIASSFFGKDFGVDTAAFFIALFVAGALSFGLTKNRTDRTFFIFSAILGSFSLLTLFHIVRFFTGPNFLSLGTFNGITSTTVGSWHDLGLYAGLSLVISLVTLELLPITNKIARSLLFAAFGLASIILLVVDLQSVWLVVGITTLAFAAYKYVHNLRSAKDNSSKKWLQNIPIFPVVVTVIAFILLWSPGVIGTFIDTNIITKAGASYTEVNLPWRYTIDIAEPTIKINPLFGAGPDRFVNQYLLYKPEIINATPFWSYSFSSGTGFILTSLVTEGIAGFIGWIVLVGFFIWFGAEALLCADKAPSGSFARYGIAASYFGAGFIAISLFDYVPQHAMMLALFILSGIFAAHLHAKGKTVVFSSGQIKIHATIILWILVAASAVFIGFYAKATIAEVYFESALRALNPGGSLSLSARNIDSALAFNKSDLYYQAASQINVYAINQIASTATTTPSQSTVQFILGLVNSGVNASLLAQKFDPTNPYNYLSEAQISTVAAGIGVPGAYSAATSSYERAITLDPFDPSIYVSLAKLDFFEKDDTGAKNNINIALQLKPDYTDALFEAGVISYTDRDYVTAVRAFTAVQNIDPTYSNIAAALNLAKTAAGSSFVQPSQAGSSTVPVQVKSSKVK